MTPPIVWRRSRRCDSGHCLEVAQAGGRVLVRDSKLGALSPVLAFDPTPWSAFVMDLRTDRIGAP